MIPLGLAGALTVVAFVGLGIFVYPWLLTQRGGALIIAAITVALAVIYYYFDRGRSSAPVAALLGLLWALLPAVAGVITRRVNRALGKP
jgi:hypothetical protein